MAIARALMHAVKLVLADEPAGKLDPESADQGLTLLRDRIKRPRAAAIQVMHSPHAAERGLHAAAARRRDRARSSATAWRDSGEVRLRHLHPAGADLPRREPCQGRRRDMRRARGYCLPAWR
jgi:hypothetical protein